MLTRLDSLYIKASNKARNTWERFRSKHEGLAGIIIAVGLILIAVIVIVYFKTKTQPALEGSIDATTDKLNGITNELNH